MLTLVRRVGEKIYIGENITITVHGIKGNSVSLSFEVPDDMNIVRAEIKGKYTPEEIAARRAASKTKRSAQPEEDVKVGFVGQAIIDLTRKK